MNIKEIDTWDLIKELQSRGYITELLLCREDVEFQIDSINENKLADDEEKFGGLDNTEIDNILDSLSYNWHSDRLYEELYDKVWEYLDEKNNLLINN